MYSELVSWPKNLDDKVVEQLIYDQNGYVPVYVCGCQMSVVGRGCSCLVSWNKILG